MVMRRSITEQRTAPAHKSSGNSPFWSTFSGQQQCQGVLRIELCSGRTWLLPYGHWHHAHLEKLEGLEQLTIQFTSHEVRVEGESLQEILIELQAGNVEVLRESAGRAHMSLGAVVIQTISITELRSVSLS